MFQFQRAGGGADESSLELLLLPELPGSLLWRTWPVPPPPPQHTIATPPTTSPLMYSIPTV